MKSVKLFKKICLLFVMVAVAFNMSAAEENTKYDSSWKRLGTKNVNGKFDEDRIHIGRWAGKLDAIQLKTNDDRINIENVVIYFTNGEQQRVRLRDDWRGGESHVIGLRGGARYVSHIVYVGTKNKSNRRANRHFNVERDREVEIWGQKANKRRRSNDRYYRDRSDNDRYYRNRTNNNRNQNRNQGCEEVRYNYNGRSY